jgi:type I restriction enzyme, S subunit
MSEWKESKLEDISIFIKDGTHGTHKDVANGIPLLSAKDIEEGKILIPDDCRTISETDYNQIHANYEIQNDDLLLTIVGTIGRVSIVKELDRKITFQRSVGIIRFRKERIFPDYSFYFFQSDEFQQTLERLKNASAQGGVYLGSLAKANIYHPISITEQCQIARILHTCDAVIETTQATIAKYKAIKQGMLHDLFTRGIDISTGKVRPKTLDAPQIYKESKLGLVPKEWVVDDFENATEIITDFTANGSFESLRINVKYYYEPNYARLIRLTDLRANLKNDGVYVDKEGYDFLSKSSLRENDIMLANVGEYTGFACLMPKVNYPVTIAPNMFLIRSNLKEFDPFYMYYFMTLDEFTRQVDNVSASSATKLLNKTNFRTMSIKKPMKKEQELIGTRLKIIDNQLFAEQSYLQKLQMIKRGLMSDLLSGKKIEKLRS